MPRENQSELRRKIYPIIVGKNFAVEVSYMEKMKYELFDSYLVFDFARYIAENEERVELNSKLIEQIKKHRAEMENWKEELESLLPRAGESATVDERILELDSKIERSIDGRAAISVPIKQGFVAEKINELISKIDQIIESE